MIAEQLPRGRRRLAREQVSTDQRGRIITATAAAMADLGYARTPVAEIIGRTGGAGRHEPDDRNSGW